MENKSSLETSTKYYNAKNFWGAVKKIRTEDKSIVENSREWGFNGTPLYLLYSETEEELHNPTTLFYHLSSILNRKRSIKLDEEVMGMKDMEILKEDLIVLSLDLLQQMGSSSSFGDVANANMNVNYDSIILKDKFVVKIPNESTFFKQQSVRNEFIIGYYGVNRVRRKIPNFIYTYGYFQCGKPTEDDFCTVDGEKTGYLVIEKVVDTIDTVTFLRNISAEETNIFLLQAALALAIAEQDIQFTHNDAHLGNILIRRLPRKEILIYEYNGTVYRILTDFIVVIIDYGYSRCTVRYPRNGAMHAVPYRSEYFLNDSSYSNGPCAVNDFFRILASTLITQGFESTPDAYNLYSRLTGMEYNSEDLRGWGKIYFIAYPPFQYPLSSVITQLYKEKTPEELAPFPVYVNVTHTTPQRLNALINGGKIEITNVLQYFEYVTGYANQPVYPLLTDEQRKIIADRTMAYLYQLYHKRSKSKVMRLIRSYCRLYAFFLFKESTRTEDGNTLLNHANELYRYMELFTDINS